MRPFRASFWAGHQHGRRPVSRRRQALGLGVLLLMVACFLGYRYLTAEVRLRRYAEQWLADFSGGEASIDRVEFSAFGGLHLIGVDIALPESAGFFPAETSPEDRTLFSAATVLLRLQPFSIITGELAVPQIIAVNPKLTLVDREEDGTGNWEVMLSRRKPGTPGKGPPRLPEIRLRNVEVQQYRINQRGRIGGNVQTFYAGAKPLPDKPEVYDLQVTRIVPNEDSHTFSGEAGRLAVDMHTGAVSGSLPSLSLEELALAAPPDIHRWLQILDMSGYVRAETFTFDPDGTTQATLRLRQARMSVPIDENEAADPLAGRYVQFSNLAGTIQLEGSQAGVELEGLFRNSPIRLQGRMLLPEGAVRGLAGIGLELNITASQVPLPRCDPETSEPEKRFVNRWHRLAEFVKDFDGRGYVDLSLQIHKESGSDKGIELVQGKLIPRGVSAAFYEFAYRLHDMSGEVNFRSDGKIDLVRLAGTHGGGKVVINGQVGGFSSHDGVKLNIQGRNIALHEDLLEHLDSEDRQLCDMFLSSAMLDLDVHMERPQAERSAPKPTWISKVDATFLDGEFVYSDFPYPLSELRGRVRINGGVMRLEELTGKRAGAVVRVSGSADRSGARAGNVDVRLHADGLPLDDALAEALPPKVRDLYRQYAPAGLADVSGRLYTADAGGQLRFDLAANLSGCELQVPDSHGRLRDVQARLQILPERLEIAELQGKLGKSTVHVDGKVGLQPDSQDITVRVRSETLELNNALRDALPEGLQQTYDSLAPSGSVRLDLLYESKTPDPAAEPQSNSPAAQASTGDYRAVVEPLNCKVTFSKFPLPLDGVNGRIVLIPGEARFEGLSGGHGSMLLQLDGRIFEEADGTGIVEISSLKARDVRFTEALRQAVPWRLRRMWNDMKPTGSCDLTLRDIRVVSAPGTERTWSLYGKLDLKQAGLSAGPEFSETDASIEGVIGFAGQFFGDTALEVRRARVDGRLIADTRARIHRLIDSSVLNIRDVVGHLYGGALLGDVEVNYATSPPSFGLSITARDVSLEGFLNGGREADTPPIQAKGSIEGRLALRGQFNRPSTRQGSGNIVVKQAQMLKLPMILRILKLVHMTDDDNAFQDAAFDFIVDGDDLILERIDLRGKAISMVGAGRVRLSTTAMHLVLLVGSPLNLPKVAVLSELVEGVARELMEVHVEGTLHTPLFRAEIARSVRRTLEAITLIQAEPAD